MLNLNDTTHRTPETFRAHIHEDVSDKERTSDMRLPPRLRKILNVMPVGVAMTSRQIAQLMDEDNPKQITVYMGELRAAGAVTWGRANCHNVELLWTRQRYVQSPPQSPSMSMNPKEKSVKKTKPAVERSSRNKDMLVAGDALFDALQDIVSLVPNEDASFSVALKVTEALVAWRNVRK